MEYLLLITSLAIILLSAEIFTNGIEWLGKLLKFSEGAIGSILAAIGTALPETMIPLIAILFGSSADAEHIGIGAILGAPFMLSTLAMFLIGSSALLFRGQRATLSYMQCNMAVFKRDLSFFILIYGIALASAFLPNHNLKIFSASFLIIAYILYVVFTLKKSGRNDNTSSPNPLLFQRKSNNPSLTIVLFQVIIALIGIVLGAHLFVENISDLAQKLSIPAYVLSIIVAPIATELPEKFNSIIWIHQGKDTLALGNVTGAMVFQSSLIPAIGIVLTPWELSPLAMTCGILALLSSTFLLLQAVFKKRLVPKNLMYAGIFYLIFIAAVFLFFGS